MSLLRQRGFLLLAAGQSLSLLADWSLRTALLIWVYALMRSGLAVSLVGLCEAIPLLVLSLVAGVFVDRWHRAHTMAGAVLARAALLLPLLAVHDRAGLPIILAVTLLASGASQFFQPAATAALPVVVGREALGAANGLLQVLGGAVPVLAPGLAAGIYAAAGPHVLVLTTMGLYAAAIPILLLIPAPRPSGTTEDQGSVRGEMVAGLRYLLAHALLVRLSLVAFVAMLGMGGLSVIDVVFVTRALHLRSELVGVLFTAYGAGSLAGGVIIWLLSRWAARRYHLVLAVAVVANGIVLIAYALAPNLVVAAAALFLCGAGFPSVMVAWMTMAQTVTDDAFMGRVMSVTNMGMAVAMIASLSASGALTDLLGVRWVIALGAGIFLTSGLLSLLLIRATPTPHAGAVEPPIPLEPPAALADAV